MTPLPAPLPAEWPPPPGAWSPSALHAVEVCPRRWALQRAPLQAYGGRPFPRRPSSEAIEGRAVHLVVERVLHALRDVGVASVRDPEVPALLRALGGLPALAGQAVADAMNDEEKNPRFATLGPPIHRRIKRRLNAIRETAQSVLASFSSVPQAPYRPSGSGGGGRRATERRQALRAGTFTEVELQATGLPLRGFADLVFRDGEGTLIVDVKTGTPGEHHADQVRLYGLAWLHDTSRNPGADPATLALQYGSRRESVPPPPSWSRFREAVAARIEAASATILAGDPPARPSREKCRYCGVRAVCTAFRADPALWCDPASPFGDLVVRLNQVEGLAHTATIDGDNPLRVRLKRDKRWEMIAGEVHVVLGVRRVDAFEGNGAPLYVASDTTEVFVVPPGGL